MHVKKCLDRLDSFRCQKSEQKSKKVYVIIAQLAIDNSAIWHVPTFYSSFELVFSIWKQRLLENPLCFSTAFIWSHKGML